MDLESRLAALGDHLDLDDGDGIELSERVIAQIDRGGHRVHWLRYAAAGLLVATIAAVAVPASRDVVAGWFGLDGVRIERRQDDDLSVETSLAPADDHDASGLPGPGDSREVTVNGRVVLVSVIEGALTDEVLLKTLEPNTDIVEIAVGNAPGLWISGSPHELAFQSPDGTFGFERIAGNTLVWQDDDVIGRTEGFETIEAAVEFAIELGTND
jgi:hypothetical protein